MLLPSLVLALAQISPGAEPPRPYDAQHYRIELRMQADGSFENTAKITLVPSKALKTLELDSFGLDVQAVTQEGAGEVPFTLAEDAGRRTGVLTLKPKATLAAKKPVTFAVRYKGKAGTANEGFFRIDDSTDPSLPPYFFTHFQPDYARRFFPCNDRPDDKATTELFAIVPAEHGVLSNGSKVKDEVYTENGQSLRRVEWKQDKPHSTYLVAVAIGKFEPVEVTALAPSTLWVQPGRKDRTFTAQDVTGAHLSFQQAFVGVKYPWAKYDQVSMPKFMWSGMENTSLVFMRENALALDHKNYIYGRTRVTSLIAHEAAHQWFGNLVTCKSWSDIWLNEGFATYLSWKAEDDYYNNDMVEVTRATRILVDYFREEMGPRSHPLVVKGAQAKDAFDATSYAKGANVLRMLEHWVGLENFKKGIKAYLEKYAHQNASSQDFFDTFMKATGTEKELKGFRDGWLGLRGYPILTAETRWTGDGKLEVTLRQKPNHAGEKGPFVFKLPVVFHRQDSPSYATKEVFLVDKPVVTFKVALPAAPNWTNWNEDGTALVKISAPAISEQQWTSAARGDPDPVWRMQAAFVLMGTMVDPDAKALAVPTDAAVDALTHVLTKDASPYVREAVLLRMAESQWKRLPEVFAPTVLALSKRPQDMEEDALGVIRVRRAALMALGKFDHQPGHDHLYALVQKSDLDLNYLPAAAVGTANVGDSEALATLRAGINTAKGRGYAYYKNTAPALGAFTSPEVVPALQALVNENAGNSELLSELLWTVHDNRILTSTAELAGFVRTFVLENKGFGDEMKARVLRLLDEVKTKDAKDALLAVAERADSVQLKQSATQVLEKNFPGALAKPEAKGKKGTKAAKGTKK